MACRRPDLLCSCLLELLTLLRLPLHLRLVPGGALTPSCAHASQLQFHKPEIKQPQSFLDAILRLSHSHTVLARRLQSRALTLFLVAYLNYVYVSRPRAAPVSIPSAAPTGSGCSRSPQ